MKTIDATKQALQDAIKHADDIAEKEGCTECGREHKQLADWLRELFFKREEASKEKAIGSLRAAIERLELEAVAATIRIENDAVEIEGWRADQKENLKNQCDLVAERDEWKERCEFSFKERDKLLATNASLVRDKESDRLAYLAMRDERDGLTREQVVCCLEYMKINGEAK